MKITKKKIKERIIDYEYCHNGADVVKVENVTFHTFDEKILANADVTVKENDDKDVKYRDCDYIFYKKYFI